MLAQTAPAHNYPELKKYKHLVGHFGGARMRQRSEFSQFPGAILMTTNCIQEPRDDCKASIFTSGLVAWHGVTHTSDKDFTPVIEAAVETEGFTDTSADKFVTVGFDHNAVLGVASTIIDVVKALPQDTICLTLGCGKFRVLNEDMGEIGGLPRRIDMGQCNDAFSAVKVAMALANAFGTDVNGLPLSLVLSWFEQKAVCILLALLHLGVKDIRIGPDLPAFITPTVLGVLVEKFGIKPIGKVEEDLPAMLNKNAA